MALLLPPSKTKRLATEKSSDTVPWWRHGRRGHVAAVFAEKWSTGVDGECHGMGVCQSHTWVSWPLERAKESVSCQLHPDGDDCRDDQRGLKQSRKCVKGEENG